MNFLFLAFPLTGKTKNGNLGIWEFLSKRVQSQACLSFAERSQKS